jgi:hypothetical protein
MKMSQSIWGSDDDHFHFKIISALDHRIYRARPDHWSGLEALASFSISVG